MVVRKIVEVEWFDAQSSMEALTIEELSNVEPLYTLSIGYLLIDYKNYIVLGYMDFGNNLIKHHTCIPKGMIKKIRIIRKGKK